MGKVKGWLSYQDKHLKGPWNILVTTWLVWWAALDAKRIQLSLRATQSQDCPDRHSLQMQRHTSWRSSGFPMNNHDVTIFDEVPVPTKWPKNVTRASRVILSCPGVDIAAFSLVSYRPPTPTSAQSGFAARQDFEPMHSRLKGVFGASAAVGSTRSKSDSKQARHQAAKASWNSSYRHLGTFSVFSNFF